MNYIAILWVDYLVYGPWKDPKGFNFPLTAQFTDAARFSEYFNTRLHSGFFLALACALILYLFMERTVWGYEIKVIGSNPKAAQYAGMQTGMAIFFVLFLSGAIAGIAGFSEVAGLQHRLQHGISPVTVIPPLLSPGWPSAALSVSLSSLSCLACYWSVVKVCS